MPSIASPAMVGLLAAVTVGAAILTLLSAEYVSILGAAFVMGLTQVGGLCGCAHVKTMSELWRSNRRTWLKATAAYTAAGLLSATVTGAATGMLGALLGAAGQPRLVTFVAAIAALLAARELRLLTFPFPDWPRRTDRTWAYAFGWTTAAAMWGFHIGVGFATVITYPGFWALVALILATGTVGSGVAIFGAYWLGRTLPLWLAPVLRHTRALDVGIAYPAYRPLHAIALLWLAVALQ